MKSIEENKREERKVKGSDTKYWRSMGIEL
jgi:hypothetical protein